MSARLQPSGMVVSQDGSDLPIIAFLYSISANDNDMEDLSARVRVVEKRLHKARDIDIFDDLDLDELPSLEANKRMNIEVCHSDLSVLDSSFVAIVEPPPPSAAPPRKT